MKTSKRWSDVGTGSEGALLKIEIQNEHGIKGALWVEETV